MQELVQRLTPNTAPTISELAQQLQEFKDQLRQAREQEQKHHEQAIEHRQELHLQAKEHRQELHLQSEKRQDEATKHRQELHLLCLESHLQTQNVVKKDGIQTRNLVKKCQAEARLRDEKHHEQVMNDLNEYIQQLKLQVKTHQEDVVTRLQRIEDFLGLPAQTMSR